MFNFITKLLRYYFLFLFGFVIACLLTALLGQFHLVEMVMLLIGKELLRLAMVIFCLLAMAIVFESLH